MGKKIKKISWSKYQTIIEKSAREIHKKYKPELIIALQRGGFIPAVSLAQEFGIKDMIPLKITRTKSDKIGSKMIKPLVDFEKLLKNIKDKKILIVDDIADHGESLIAAQKSIEKNNPAEIKTFVFVTNEDHLKESLKKPRIDFVGARLKNIDWVIFPWDKK